MSFGGGNGVVWGGIYRQEKTPLAIVNNNVTAEHYTDDILRSTVLPFLHQQPRGVVYRHDNA